MFKWIQYPYFWQHALSFWLRWWASRGGASCQHVYRRPPCRFAPIKMLWVHLGEINTTDNMVDGGPSTLLTCIKIRSCLFGDIKTISINHLEHEHLHDSLVWEWKITVWDETGELIDNHHLSISVTLEIRSEPWVSSARKCVRAPMKETSWVAWKWMSWWPMTTWPMT